MTPTQFVEGPLFFIASRVSDSEERGKLISGRLKEEGDRRYTKVIRFLCDAFDVEFDFTRIFPSFFLTFTALCDIALNPPLPPFVLTAPVGDDELWFEIYPPSRLFRATREAAQIGYLDGMLVSGKVESYQRLICKAAKMCCHWDYPDPWHNVDLLEWLSSDLM